MKIQIIGSGSMWTKFNSACKYLFCDCMLDIGSKSHQGIDNYKIFVDKYNSVLEDKKKKKKLITPQEIIATNSYRLK